MADPLSQLRQFFINGRDIKEQNGYIIFGEHGWPKDVNTNYQIYSTDDDKSEKRYYTLECLLYFLKNMDLQHPHYVKQAGTDKKPAVMRPDRMQLLAYLKGESQTATGIDKNAPIPSLRVPVSEIFKKDSSSGGSQVPGNQSSGDASRSDARTSSAQKRLPHDEDISKRREEFAARLNEPSTKKLATTLPTEDTRSTTDANESSAAIMKLGKERVAAMKAKRMANKRTEIIDAESEPGAGLGPEAGNREDLLYVMDAEKIKLIKSKEKIWRTRSSILQSNKKDFGKPILKMLELLAKSDDPTRKPHSSSMAPPHDPLMLNAYPSQNSSQQQQQAIQKSYNRYDQERFVKLDIGVEIDTKKSFVGGVSNGPAPPASRPMGPVPSNGALALPRPPGDVIDHRRTPSQKPSKRISTVPIIIIPATTTSIINMYNAATILQDLTYVEGKPGSRHRENEILIQRRKQDGTSAHYKIIDNPQKLEQADWQRVVAVFVQGPSWQFKGWPWNGEPVDIFSRIKGFHLKWDEAKIDDNVDKWDVQVLELSRNKRHLDKANLMRFWSALDVYMNKYKTYLKF